ncbi:alpha/beta hydrolase [Mycobacterium sp. 2YAF39]|uniref:alpha/beta hydrolase n=1 Tax=Mycobacterium sp. 2YAF39 TaxID=3233033 RepID=UPI003F975CAC
MSLTHGWVPITVQILAACVLLAAIGWRTRRWRLVWVPVAAVIGAALTALTYWYIHDQGWSQDRAPVIVWLWIALTGVAAVVAIVGWRDIGWWQRVASLLAVPLCLLCAALAVNIWVAYVPTVQSAWDRVRGVEPERWVDQSTLADMQRRGERPTQGVVVRITTPDTASGFLHRPELVYLPPVWFTTNPPPKLPAVMMFNGEFGYPFDWLLSANALDVLDKFTAAHNGNAPVMVFPDTGGKFSNDTECVNGPRGNAADHLIKDVVPFVIANFGVSSDPANWGLGGWSAGGTCAVMLGVLHPELFSAILDIDGQLGPNAGSRKQTLARLFGGDEAAWAAFDPKTIITRHGRYSGMAAWLAVSTDTPTVYRDGNETLDPAVLSGWDANSEDHVVIANSLCSLMGSQGIECAVVGTPSSHDFAGAAKIFAAALPWLSGWLGTPGVPAIPLPGSPNS